MSGLALVAVMVVGTVGYAMATSGLMPWARTFASEAPTGPDVKYPVFGSNDLSLYLARSMVAQEPTIELAWMESDAEDRRSEVKDALLEVAAQNPYVYIDEEGWTLTEDDTLLTPRYVYGNTEAEERRLQTQTAVNAILDSEPVASAVGEVPVTRALYEALINVAEYDDAAEFSRGVSAPAQAESEAFGALVDHQAVGEGYAKAFVALARARDLSAVVVTGTAFDGEVVGEHAWNRVLIADAWLVLDAAFDDRGSGGADDEFFLLDPRHADLATRAEDTDWLVDDVLWQFVP